MCIRDRSQRPRQHSTESVHTNGDQRYIQEQKRDDGPPRLLSISQREQVSHKPSRSQQSESRKMKVEQRIPAVIQQVPKPPKVKESQQKNKDIPKVIYQSSTIDIEVRS